MAIVVDGKGYELCGFDTSEAAFSGSSSAVKQTSVAFTPTSTTFSMQAGLMDVNLTFLSPIEVLSLCYICDIHAKLMTKLLAG